MSLSAALNTLKSSNIISWKPSGRFQQTLAECIELSGIGLHSGKPSTVKLWPELAGKGRYFQFKSESIPASIGFAAKHSQSPLCTTLSKDGLQIRTVEHLLSALEATGVHNCRIQIHNFDSEEDQLVEVPIFDGSASTWVEAIQQVGVVAALDQHGNNDENMLAYLNEPVHMWRNDSFVAAFPCPKVQITYGIDFPQVPAIGCKWFSSTPLDDDFYEKHIASSRTFCIFEEVERMRDAGLIKGGSLDNAIVCSASKGWLNPPLRFHDEPCRHKVLDLVGDISLFARSGSQGLPVAHIVAFKGGHALHTDFVRRLSQMV
ncbi:LpxC domain-containing protein [Cephalotus follicularis]|uniref:UDP-3-O-acyl-N-acetylglucosamine deacetylase n=1 Tax=Cephalotus follicularis TaxID=3775 RepID=A0A1Q3BSJ5_CEPFO|nr:LpxC domain-containing protein [Cephalotus follicularis]